MTERVFHQRLHCQYSQPDNAVAGFAVEHRTQDGWQPFELSFATPGFEAFVYAIFNCQHLYMRVNAAERGLLLASAEGSIEAIADEDWTLRKLQVRFEARLQSGNPSESHVADILDRMRHCPVSTNLKQPPEMVVEVRFG